MVELALQVLEQVLATRSSSDHDESVAECSTSGAQVVEVIIKICRMANVFAKSVNFSCACGGVSLEDIAELLGVECETWGLQSLSVIDGLGWRFLSNWCWWCGWLSSCALGSEILTEGGAAGFLDESPYWSSIGLELAPILGWGTEGW